MTIESLGEIAEIMYTNEGVGSGKDQKPFVANYTGYREGGENYEHDDTGDSMNFSGVVDQVYEAVQEHEGWQEGYDY